LNDAVAHFRGRLLIVAPHMDDEVLACGGLVASLPDPGRVHVVYATDGMKSPAPVFPSKARVPPDLGALRCRESVEAMAVLGVPAGNLRFLGLPEARLRRSLPQLSDAVLAVIDELQPDHVLVPFRFDRHPDHLAVNRVITRALLEGRLPGALAEYFVYHRWRLLPGRDLRAYVRPDRMVEVDMTPVAARKRAALECFRSQVTRYYPWQTRPILTPELLDDECRRPERFLRYDPALPGARVLTRARGWIRVAHRLEPALQRTKHVLKTAGQQLVARR
jgi:LmbE family N-acetylglucosaminyl deacetylase